MLYFPKYSALEITDIGRKADVEHATVLLKSQFFQLSPLSLCLEMAKTVPDFTSI